MSNLKRRVAVIGLGLQGSGIARLLVEHGYDLVGAVDVGEKVGRPISEFLDGVGPVAPVSGSIDDLLAGVESLDVAVLAAAIPADQLVDQARTLLQRGIDVLTLHQDLLSPDPSWTPELNQVALDGGASFLSTGVQDTWWIHIPVLVTSSSTSVTNVRVVSSLSLESISVGLAEMIGVGRSPEQFVEAREMMLHAPAVLGAALQETARKMGCVPGELTKTFDAITSGSPYEWGVAGTTIPAGHAAGTIEEVSFDTDQRIHFEGVFQVLPVPLEDACDELIVTGNPSISLRYQPFPGTPITNAALLSRIPDVVDAAPGVLFAADLPPSRPHFPLR